jgi:hypothetical protein
MPDVSSWQMLMLLMTVQNGNGRSGKDNPEMGRGGHTRVAGSRHLARCKVRGVLHDTCDAFSSFRSSSMSRCMS